MKELTRHVRHTKKGELIERLAGQFAHAAGYSLTDDNVNQWRLAMSSLIDGILELIEEPSDAPEES